MSKTFIEKVNDIWKCGVCGGSEFDCTKETTENVHIVCNGCGETAVLIKGAEV